MSTVTNHSEQGLFRTTWFACPWLKPPILMALALQLVCALANAGEPWRVATFKLDFSPPGSPGTLSNALRQATVTLNVSSPDVVLLHGAPHWAACETLARSLGPETYRVVVCSAFTSNRAGAAAVNQAAIISKHQAYLAWAENWQRSPGGYAFASFRAPAGRVGFFVVSLDAQRNPLDFESEWEDAVAGFRAWQTNKLDAAVVSADFHRMPGISSSFSRALAAPFPLPSLASLTADGAAVVDLPNRPERLPAFITTACPATFSINPGALELQVSLPADKAQRPDGGTAPTAAGGDAGGPGADKAPRALGVLTALNQPVWLGLGGLALTLIILRLLSPRKAASQPTAISLLPVSEDRQPSVESQARRGFLSMALNDKVVGKLVADRTILMDNQGAATESVKAAENLVGQVEEQVRQQAHAYEARIEGLMRELAAANDENRMLIQARIEQIKAEMAVGEAGGPT